MSENQGAVGEHDGDGESDCCSAGRILPSEKPVFDLKESTGVATRSGVIQIGVGFAELAAESIFKICSELPPQAYSLPFSAIALARKRDNSWAIFASVGEDCNDDSRTEMNFPVELSASTIVGLRNSIQFLEMLIRR